jgi:hypothetical protein
MNACPFLGTPQNAERTTGVLSSYLPYTGVKPYTVKNDACQIAFFAFHAFSSIYKLINGSDWGFPGFCAKSRLKFYPHDPGYRMDILVPASGEADNDALFPGKGWRQFQDMGDGV